MLSLVCSILICRQLFPQLRLLGLELGQLQPCDLEIVPGLLGGGIPLPVGGDRAVGELAADGRQAVGAQRLQIQPELFEPVLVIPDRRVVGLVLDDPGRVVVGGLRLLQLRRQLTIVQVVEQEPFGGLVELLGVRRRGLQALVQPADRVVEDLERDLGLDPLQLDEAEPLAVALVILQRHHRGVGLVDVPGLVGELGHVQAETVDLLLERRLGLPVLHRSASGSTS